MTLPLISMRQITKRFPGVIANNKINLELYPGEIHALLGENGSGKSTLMSILTGLYKPTEGCIMVGGEEVKFASPADAIASGIGMVHQHFKLIESFTVAENIVLSQSKGGFLLKPEQIIADIESLGEKWTAGRSAGLCLAAWCGRKTARGDIADALSSQPCADPG